MNYTVHHYNFGRSCQFDTYEEAVAFAKQACFEAVIRDSQHIVATFSPISGLRELA